MSISNYAELKILDHTTGRAAWTAPSGVYLKLHTGDAGEDGTANAATETYSHWSLWDASTSGNCLWTGALSSSAAVTAGDTFQITSLTLSLD